MLRLVFLLLLASFGTCNAGDCLEIQARCARDSICNEIQGSYLRVCLGAFANRVCSDVCKATHMEILSNEIGCEFDGCDCGTSTVCALYTKNLLATCYNGVIPKITCPIATPTPEVTTKAATTRALTTTMVATTPKITPTMAATTMEQMTTNPPGCPKERPGNMLREKGPRGLRKMEMIPVGTKLTYKCRRRYDLVGSESRVCQPDGQYSAARPYCEVSCPSHCVSLSVSNGEVSMKLKKKVVLRVPTKRSYKNVCEATVTCSEGLQQVSGPTKLYCSAKITGWVDSNKNINMADLVCE